MTGSALLYLLYKNRLPSGNAVDGLGQTGDLSGSIVLMINAPLGSFINGRSSFEKSFGSRILIVGSDSSFDLLDSGLYGRLDRFIAVIVSLADKNSLLCRFDISQFVHLLT